MTYKKAELYKRIIAFLIDHTIIILIALSFMMINFNEIFETYEMMFHLFVRFMLFSLVFYLVKDVVHGKSIGKWFMGIKIIDVTNEQKPSIFRLILRNALIFIWPVEFIVLLISKDSRRIGDKLAKTNVVKETKILNKKIRIVVIVIFSIVFISFIFLTAIQSVKTSEGYKTAINYIEHNKNIKEITGEITGFGTIPLGSINTTNGHGQANFKIKVIGDEKNLSVYITLTKQPGEEWKVVDFKY